MLRASLNHQWFLLSDRQKMCELWRSFPTSLYELTFDPPPPRTWCLRCCTWTLTGGWRQVRSSDTPGWRTETSCPNTPWTDRTLHTWSRWHTLPAALLDPLTLTNTWIITTSVVMETTHLHACMRTLLTESQFTAGINPACKLNFKTKACRWEEFVLQISVTNDENRSDSVNSYFFYQWIVRVIFLFGKFRNMSFRRSHSPTWDVSI